MACIAAGPSNSGAVTSGGALWLWGAGADGQLARGTVMGSADPLEPGLRPALASALDGQVVVSVAIGASHMVALLPAGTALAWGANQFGQCGVGGAGSTIANPTAVPLRGYRLVQVMLPIQSDCFV